MKRLIIITAICLFVPLFGGTLMAEVRLPLYLLYQTKGQVQFSRDGKNFRSVTNSKFIFNNYQIKTGKNSTCKLLDQSNHSIQMLLENTHIIISNKTIQSISGKFIPEGDAQGILDDIQQKFVKALRYTVVRRSVSRSQSTSFELNTVKKIKLCKQYPDIVWQHVEPGCHYRLIIDQNQFEVSEIKASNLIRFSVPELSPGVHEYMVLVIKDGKIVFQPDKKRTLYWLSDKEQQDIIKGKQFIETIDPDNGFLFGNYMEEKGLIVAAMDEYRSFFENNPDENEMRPFLIKVYSDLKLTAFKLDEINKYNAVQ